MLKLNNLSFTYDDKTILDNINIEFSSSKNVLILAESESGKTTFASVVSSLATTYSNGVQTGTVLLDGKEYTTPYLLEHLALVMQDASSFILSTNILEELAFPLESLALSKEEMEKRIQEESTRWKLDLKRNTSTLSGGEVKRLALATALISKPKFKVLDESFDDLDKENRALLASEIKNDKGYIVLASHYIKEFDSLFDKTYILENGKIEEKDPSDFKLKEFNILKSSEEKHDELSCENLSIQRGQFKLNIPSFNIKSGEIVCLTGANGSGKSTFSLSLCNIIKAESGKIYFNKNQIKDLNRKVGYVFQNPDLQLFMPTVKEELSYGMESLNLTKSEKDDRLKQLAKDFILDLDQITSLCSYGKRKRVQAAIYYDLDRPFYILDELDSALNYSSVIHLINTLKSKGSGIIIITHDEAFCQMLNARVYKIEDGEVCIKI